MRLQPLVLSVHGTGRTSVTARSSCPFCGVRLAEGGAFSAPRRERRGLMRALSFGPSSRTRHDRRGSGADLASGIDPACSQCVGFRLAREGALQLAAAPFAVSAEDGSYGALEAIRAFASRSGEAEARLGTNSPGVLAMALMRAKRQVYADRARLLGGLRLWSRGRFFVGGEDIYPRLIG